jgi:hypothetical protein
MNRRTQLILLLVLAVFAAVGVRYAVKRRAQRRREIAYQAALASFIQAVKPGMSRKEVERYIEMTNESFQQTCCTTVSAVPSKHSWDDLVWIGKEDAPWFCSENNVYVAFEFEGFSETPGKLSKPRDLDRLQSIALYHRLEGCL